MATIPEDVAVSSHYDSLRNRAFHGSRALRSEALPRPLTAFCSLSNGARVAYATLGDGPDVLMLPGWLSHLQALWAHPNAARVQQRFSDNNRFIWYDRLGCGLSDRDPGPMSLDHDVAQLLAVFDAAGIERCSLIGHSLGGPAAMAFAARYPERVDRLVLCSTFARGSAVVELAQITAFQQLVRANWDLGSRALASMFLPNGSSRDIAWYARLQQQTASTEVAVQLLDHLWQLDVRDHLATLRSPTLILHHRHDRAVPLAAAEEISALLPHARLEILDREEHDPFIRHSTDVIEAILGFLHHRDPACRARPSRSAEPLTRREREVLQLITQGAPNKIISSTLGITVSTVERHLTHLYAKLGARGRAYAAMRAVRHGLVSTDNW